MTLRLGICPLVGLVLTVNLAASADVITFENMTLPTGGYLNGNPGDLSPGDAVSVPFQLDGVSFSNTFGIDADWDYSYWNGFAISNVVNTTDGTFSNQYAAKPGSGHQSTNYAVAYSSSAMIAFPEPVTVSGFRIANTTYAFGIMTETDPNGFSSPLGPGDWFSVTATGSLDGNVVAAAEFLLADLRGAAPVGVRSDWSWFDLAALGTIDSLSFSFAGSDVGDYGLNTPAYFAMDNLTYAVPEPSGLLLAACGAAGCIVWRRRKRAV